MSTGQQIVIVYVWSKEILKLNYYILLFLYVIMQLFFSYSAVVNRSCEINISVVVIEVGFCVTI